jgi:hypothetical protein
MSTLGGERPVDWGQWGAAGGGGVAPQTLYPALPPRFARP